MTNPKKILSQLFILLFIMACSNPNEKKSSLEVSGNCEMCKQTIEKSLAVDGIYEANWDMASHKLNLSFDTALISLETIATHVAVSGYDNALIKADDKVYNQLPDCCHYPRRAY